MSRVLDVKVRSPHGKTRSLSRGPSQCKNVASPQHLPVPEAQNPMRTPRFRLLMARSSTVFSPVIIGVSHSGSMSRAVVGTAACNGVGRRVGTRRQAASRAARTSARALADIFLRRGVAGASCIIFDGAAATLYLGDVDAGLTPRKRTAAYFCRNHQQADFRKSLSPVEQLSRRRVRFFTCINNLSLLNYQWI